ncbi:hypothetical protein LXA43DRAFT_876314 [Ganoderma leucocontextum]|nr:hypothetical protein LXA43DRAFT_876314 [Ganoderma leucocontextum]
MPIGFLPTELLQLIFRIVRDDALAGNDEDMSWMSLARVCRNWRNIVHEDPLLWTQLAFNKDTPPFAIEVALSRSRDMHGVHLKFDAGSSLSFGGWLVALSRPHGSYTLPTKVHFLSFRWHQALRDKVFDFLEGLRADGVVSLAIEECENTEDPVGDDDAGSWHSSWDNGDFLYGHETEPPSESESEPETGSADDEDEYLSELDSGEDGDPTGAQTGDVDDLDREDLDETVSDIEESGSDVSDHSGDEDDELAVEFVGPPRILRLPHFASLINLAASSVLLSIPLQVKEHLTDMTLMRTVYRSNDFTAAGVVQSWVLDVLEGCVQLGRLRLCSTLNIEGHDPEERTVALPNLKFLCLEDFQRCVQDILRFLDTSPETLARVDLRTVFYSAVKWDPVIDGVFVGNLPADVASPYFEDTTALNLWVDDEFALQGRMRATESDSASGLRQWELTGICIPDGWSRDDRNRLLPLAVLELSHPRIVIATNIVDLAIHIAPNYLAHEIDWADLISSLPHVRKLSLGSDGAVEAFLGATLHWHTHKLRAWRDLTELHFCLAVLRSELGRSMTNLCEELWGGRDSRRLDLKVFLRLPGAYAPQATGGGAPEWFARPEGHSSLEQSTRTPGYRGRLQIVADTCRTCHQPEEYVDATYV